MYRKTVALVLALLVFVPMSAAAHVQTVLDSDDTDSPMDIVAARTNHYGIAQSHPEKFWTELSFKLVTYETWTYEAILGGKNFVGFEIDLDDDKQMERCIVITAQIPQEGEALSYQVNVYEGCNYFDDRLIRSFGTEKVKRRDEHSIAVTLRKRAVLGPGVTSFRWRAVTSFEEQRQDAACPAPEPHGDGGYGACADFTRWKRHSV